MPHLTAAIFAVLSVVFAAFTVRDYLRGGGKLSLSGRVWLRIALIFAAVGILLMVLI